MALKVCVIGFLKRRNKCLNGVEMPELVNFKRRHQETTGDQNCRGDVFRKTCSPTP